MHTEDHPLEYLDFHGDIPKGEYGAGTMTDLGSGTYETHKWEERKVEVTFHGERLRAATACSRSAARAMRMPRRTG